MRIEISLRENSGKSFVTVTSIDNSGSMHSFEFCIDPNKVDAGKIFDGVRDYASEMAERIRKDGSDIEAQTFAGLWNILSGQQVSIDL